MVSRVRTVVAAAGPGGEYTEQVRPVTTGRTWRPVLVAHGSGSDGSSYVVERPPNAGKPPGDQLPHASRAVAGDGWCLTASALGGGAVGGTYDPADAADRLADLAATVRSSDPTWGGCADTRVVVVGVSMGMITAVAAALRHPGLVAGIVGIVPVISATYVWDLFAAPVPAEVMPYDPSTHTAELAAADIPIAILSSRLDEVVDTIDGTHHAAFTAAIPRARRWRFTAGPHGMTGVTAEWLRAALDHASS